MGVISTKSIDQPDEIVSGPGVDKRIVMVGKTVIARIECRPGWRWSKDLKPTAKTVSCQHHHQGVVLSGRLHITSEEGGERIIGPGDAFDILPGHDASTVGDESCVMIEFQGARDWGKRPESGGRVLATLMVTDIVGSTAAAARLGDSTWKALLARHYDSVRRELDSFRGIEVDTSGDGFLAMFDGAAPRGSLHGIHQGGREAGRHRSACRRSFRRGRTPWGATAWCGRTYRSADSGTGATQ